MKGKIVLITSFVLFTVMFLVLFNFNPSRTYIKVNMITNNIGTICVKNQLLTIEVSSPIGNNKYGFFRKIIQNNNVVCEKNSEIITIKNIDNLKPNNNYILYDF